MTTHGKIVSFIALVAIVIIVLAINSRAQQTPSLSDTTPPIQQAGSGQNSSLFVPAAGDGTYSVNAEATTLGWSSERIVGNSHTGAVPVAGFVEVLEGETIGEFTIDMTQISEDTSNQRFLEHIASAAFFDVATYPTASLSLTNIQTTEDLNMYTITADLTIKDISHSISFPAEIIETDNTLTAAAEFEIDRTKWDITFDSGSIFQEIGDKAIKDDIQFSLQLSLVKE